MIKILTQPLYVSLNVRKVLIYISAVFAIGVSWIIDDIFSQQTITANSFIELIFKELILAHIYFTLAVSVILYLTFKFSSTFKKTVLKVIIAFVLALLLSISISLRNVAIWIVMRNIVSDFQIVSYKRFSGGLDSPAFSSIQIKNNGMKGKDLQALIEQRIENNKSILNTFAPVQMYMPRAFIYINKQVPGVGIISPDSKNRDYDSFKGDESIFLDVR